MPEPPPIADAARLAAQASQGSVLAPTDDSIERAYLDLREDRPEVALSKLAAVSAAFAPRLHLQAGLKLLVATGELNPDEAARGFAVSLIEAGGENGSPRIAVVRGEDALGRLEELIQTGCVYRQSGRSLAEEHRPVAAAWAPPPASVVEGAFDQGASVVVSRGGEFEPGEADREAVTVRVRLIEEYRLSFHLPSAGVGEAALRSLSGGLSDRVTVSLQESAQAARIVASAVQIGPLADAAARLELALPAGSVARPLAQLITRSDEHDTVEAPASLFDFAPDLRAANEWLGDTPEPTDQ